MKGVVAVVLMGLLVAGCASDAEPSRQTQPGPPVSEPESSTRNAETGSTGAGSSEATASAPAGKSATHRPKCKVGPTHTADGTRRFWTKDKRCFTSRWFARAHRVMIYFGCTKAPYYDPAPSCPGRQAIHHGIDVDMPSGTPVFAGVRGRIVKGTVGSAYGSRAFILRTRRHDIVIGHVRKALRRDGARVRKGQRIALSGKRGAPDGPHLHFEVRPRGGSYTQAIPPKRFLRLRVKR